MTRYRGLNESVEEFFDKQIRGAQDAICVAQAAKRIICLATELPEMNDSRLSELVLQLGNCEAQHVLEYVEVFVKPWAQDEDPNIREIVARIVGTAKGCRATKFKKQR